MPKARYWMTPTARAHYRKAIMDTRERWGIAQAETYRKVLREGFEHIAENHRAFNSPHRDQLAEGTGFSLHLVGHRYVVFQEHDRNSVIIAGIFHESMDIPARLRELGGLTRLELSTLKREIEREVTEAKEETIEQERQD